MLRIGLELDMVGGYGREVLRGLMQYADLIGTWEFIMPKMYAFDRTPLAAEETHGLVSMVHNPADIRGFVEMGIPVVNVAHTLTDREIESLGLPSVVPDDAKVGAAAFEYFRERGFRNYAFCGHPTVAWSCVREESFAQAAQNAGFSCAVSRVADAVPLDWVRSLPPRVAVLGANDRYAWHCINACRELGIRVPEDLAVLGVDNDTLIAEMVAPALSSVKPAAFMVGIEAGRLLQELIQSPTTPPRIVRVPPDGIVTRLSTEVLMIDDPAVVSAVRFIRLNASRPIGVNDVLDEVMLSRRNLERRFRAVLDRTLLDEIRRVRVERACDLLRETSFDMPAIAESCGFLSHVRFSTVFRQMLGMSPSTYRRRYSVHRAPDPISPNRT
jgi:LacI family transcriptional regulator